MSEHWGRPVRTLGYSFVINFSPLVPASTEEQLLSLTNVTKFGNKVLATAQLDQ
jgi:hypothetical protein